MAYDILDYGIKFEISFYFVLAFLEITSATGKNSEIEELLLFTTVVVLTDFMGTMISHKVAI